MSSRRRIVALPYATAEPGRVSIGPWTDDGGAEVTELPDWDYATEVRLVRTAEIDVAGVRSDCHLGDAAELAVSVVWRASGTSRRGALPAIPIPAGEDRFTAPLEVVLPGEELGGELALTTRLLLGGGGGGGGGVAPALVGSILWEDRHTVMLQGAAARFPMEVVDFAEARMPAPDAAWHLVWPREDLNEPILGQLRLYLNSRHPTIRRLVDGELDEPTVALILSVVKFDTTRTLITGALGEADFLEDPEGFPEGSVGNALFRMTNAFWPDESLASLQSHLSSRPDAFHTALQDRVRILRDD